MALVKKTDELRDGGNERATPRAVPDLIAMLSSPDAGARRWAALDLAGAGDAAPTLVGALSSETDLAVRDAILTTLAGLDNALVPELLAVYLRSPDAGLRNAVAETIAQLAGTPAIIETLLSDPDPHMRIIAVMVLTLMADPSVPAWLASVVEDDQDPRVVASAIGELAELGDTSHLPLLARARARFPDDPFVSFTVGIAEERVAQS
jgi:HEAT repeat protein